MYPPVTLSAENHTNQLVGIGGWAGLGHGGLDLAFGVGAGLAEGHEGGEGFLGRGGEAAGLGRRGAPGGRAGVHGQFGGEAVDLAAQFGDDGLGETLADLGQLGEGLGVLGDDPGRDCPDFRRLRGPAPRGRCLPSRSRPACRRRYGRCRSP